VLAIEDEREERDNQGGQSKERQDWDKLDVLRRLRLAASTIESFKKNKLKESNDESSRKKIQGKRSGEQRQHWMRWRKVAERNTGNAQHSVYHSIAYPSATLLTTFSKLTSSSISPSNMLQPVTSTSINGCVVPKLTAIGKKSASSAA
jgi:hypothetical protein